MASPKSTCFWHYSGKVSVQNLVDSSSVGGMVPNVIVTFLHAVTLKFKMAAPKPTGLCCGQVSVPVDNFNLFSYRPECDLTFLHSVTLKFNVVGPKINRHIMRHKETIRVYDNFQTVS